METDPGVRTEATTEISHLKFMQTFISGNWLDSQIPFFLAVHRDCLRNFHMVPPNCWIIPMLSASFTCSPISSLFLASDSSQGWQIPLWFLPATLSKFPSHRQCSNPIYVKDLLLGGSNAFWECFSAAKVQIINSWGFPKISKPHCYHLRDKNNRGGCGVHLNLFPSFSCSAIPEILWSQMDSHFSPPVTSLQCTIFII